MNRISRQLIVFMLGFSSGLPLALLTSTLQAWFSSTGMSVFATGMLGLMGLPYLFSIVLAPILDRYSLLSIGKRRSWILVTQILLCIGFNFISWFSPPTSARWIAVIAFGLAIFSAIQDMAINAHRIEFLPKEEHGLGASLATIGYRIALFVGGGVALILAQYLDWVVAYRVMGCLMLIGTVAIYYSPEPSKPFSADNSLSTIFLEPIRSLFAKSGIWLLILFVFFYKLGEAFTTTTSGIVMPFLIQGLGFSLDTITYVNQVTGVITLLLGGLVAGLLLIRWSLFRALMLFGLIQVITNGLFVLLANAGDNLPLFIAAVVSDNFAAGMGTTALVALLMRSTESHYTATQFTILVTIASIPRVLSGPIGAILQPHLGWVGLYQLSCILALGFIPFLYLLRHRAVVSLELIRNPTT